MQRTVGTLRTTSRPRAGQNYILVQRVDRRTILVISQGDIINSVWKHYELTTVMLCLMVVYQLFSPSSELPLLTAAASQLGLDGEGH